MTWPVFLMTNADIPWVTSKTNTSKVLLKLHLQNMSAEAKAVKHTQAHAKIHKATSRRP